MSTNIKPLLLKTRVADLEEEMRHHKQEVERCKNEHVSLLNSNVALGAARDRLREDLARDYEMLGAAFDGRIDELKRRIRTTSGDGDEPALVEAVHEFAQDVREHIHICLDQQELRITEWVAKHFTDMMTLYRQTTQHQSVDHQTPVRVVKPPPGIHAPAFNNS